MQSAGNFLIGLFALLAVLLPIRGREINYAAAPEAPRQTAAILFGGDMIFDRSVRKAMDAKGGDFIFSCIDPVLRAADLVVANLEGPITEHASVSATSTPGDEFNYTFTFPTSTAPLLFAHNVRIVNLGNNHILNFGVNGARSTVAALRRAGVAYFGLPALAEAEAGPDRARAGDPILQNVATSTVNGIVFAFINYNEFALSPHRGKLEFVSMLSRVIMQIQTARAAGEIPIVYTHWGAEYATTSSANSRELAHSFIDAGAEIVIGSHPHVVEEHDTYRGKHIYYSLGNFIFDQYFSDDVRRGLLLKVAFSPGGAENVREIPIELLSDRRTCPIEAADAL